MATEFRLSDEDLATYGEGKPEWVTFDRDKLTRIPFDQLYPWEEEIKEQTDRGIAILLATEYAGFTGLGIKVVVWLTWQINGLEPPPFKDFNIQPLAVTHRPVKAKGGDAVPPARGSSARSSTAKRSEKR